MERHKFLAQLSVSTEEFFQRIAECRNWCTVNSANTCCISLIACRMTDEQVIAICRRLSERHVSNMQVWMTGLTFPISFCFYNATSHGNATVALWHDWLHVAQRRRFFIFLLFFSCSDCFWICIWNDVKCLFSICWSFGRRILLLYSKLTYPLRQQREERHHH